MINRDESPHSAFLANRYEAQIAKLRRGSALFFPLWVRTTPCFTQTNSYLVRDAHGTTRRTVTRPVNVPFARRTRKATQ